MVVRSERAALPEEQYHKFHVFVGRIVHSKSLENLEILTRGALGVRGDGTIAFLRSLNRPVEDICREEQGFYNAEITHLDSSQFLMPGLIDTHLHAPQWPNLALGMGGQLREWVENYTNPVEVCEFTH